MQSRRMYCLSIYITNQLINPDELYNDTDGVQGNGRAVCMLMYLYYLHEAIKEGKNSSS